MRSSKWAKLYLQFLILKDKSPTKKKLKVCLFPAENLMVAGDEHTNHSELGRAGVVSPAPCSAPARVCFRNTISLSPLSGSKSTRPALCPLGDMPVPGARLGSAGRLLQCSAQAESLLQMKPVIFKV